MTDSVTTIRRRRRSWHRRRVRFQRILVAVVVGILLVGACWQNAAHYFSLPSLHTSQLLPDSFWIRGNVHKDLALMASHSANAKKVATRIPGVYPYSIIPGGIKDLSDLKYAALRDYVVRRHYARFDFNHAQLIHAKEPRMVYLSYRVRDDVFWTHKKVRLHPGELLLTDGKITARARCGNQISDTAKPEVSNEEPAEDILDQPVIAALEPGPAFPARPLFSALDLPGGVPSSPQILTGSFIFPYVPIGVPIPSGLCRPNDTLVNGRCLPKHHKPVVPEPSTIFLAVTGLAFIAWRYRSNLRPVHA